MNNYNNIKFIDYPDLNFYSNLPNNIIIVGGGKYDINLENKIKNYDCVIRIHPYRAYHQHRLAREKNIITKTDYIYTWTGRALSLDLNLNNNLEKNKIIDIDKYTIENYDTQLNKMIPNLKGIIFYIDVNNKCNIGCDQLNQTEKELITKLYHNNNKIKENYILLNNRKNNYIIEYLKKDNYITPTKINHFLEYLDIENKIYNNCSITSGLKIILNCLYANKNITIIGFSLNIDEVKVYETNKQDYYNSKKKCRGQNCSFHSLYCEANIINELISKNRINLLS